MTGLEAQPHKKMARPGVLARNAAANLSQRGVAWLIVLFLPPLLVRHMDKPSYATWMLLLQLGAYISLVEMSFQGAAAYFVARGEGLRDKNYVGNTLSSAAVILAGTATAACIFTAFVSLELPRFFHRIPRSIAAEASVALVLVGLSLAMAQPFSIIAGYFKGLQRGEVTAAVSATGKLAGAFGVGWAAYHHQGIVVMAAYMAAGTLVSPAIYTLAWRRLGERGLLGISRVSVQSVKEFVRYWAGRAATQLCAAIITGLDLPIVAAFDFSSAGYYAVAATLSNMLLVPQAAITNALLPVTSSMGAYASPAELGVALVKVTRHSVAILFLICIPILSGMKIFLRVWVGHTYAVHAYPIAFVLTTAMLVGACFGPFVLFAASVGQQERALISPAVEAAVNFTFSIVLVHRIGALGVALGTLIGACVAFFIHLAVSVHLVDAVQVQRGRLVVQGMLRPAACVLPSVAFLCIVTWIGPPTNLHVAAILCGEILAVIGLLIGNFSAEERAQILALAKRIRRAMTGNSNPPQQSTV